MRQAFFFFLKGSHPPLPLPYISYRISLSWGGASLAALLLNAALDSPAGSTLGVGIVALMQLQLRLPLRLLSPYAGQFNPGWDRIGGVGVGCALTRAARLIMDEVTIGSYTPVVDCRLVIQE